MASGCLIILGAGALSVGQFLSSAFELFPECYEPRISVFYTVDLNIWIKSYGTGMKIQWKHLSSTLGGTSHMLVPTFVSVDRSLCCHLCQESVLANSLISETVKQILCCGIQPSVAALLYGIFFQYFFEIRSYSPVFFLHVWN